MINAIGDVSGLKARVTNAGLEYRLNGKNDYGCL